MYTFNQDLVVSEGKSGAGVVPYDDRFHIKSAKLAGDTYIQSAITYLGGNGGQYGKENYPILMETLGKGKKMPIKQVDNIYKIRMIGKPKVTTTISQVVVQSNPGLNGAECKIRVADKLFETNQEIYSGGVNAITLKVLDDGKQIAKGVIEYTVKRSGLNGHLGIPAKFLTYGTVWGSGLIKVSQEDSHGTKQRTSQTPFELQNQITTFRRSYTYRGNVKNKVLVIPIQVDGKILNTWSDWDYYNNMLQFNVERNEDLIFSETNLNSNGVVTDLDAKSGEPARSGMGIWDMITNVVEYAELTKKKLDDPISDIFKTVGSAYGLNGDYMLVGGLGFLQDFDKVVSSTARGFLTLLGENYFITKGADGLRYGNYFTEYRHHSGKIIRVGYDASFDKSARAQTSGIHPISGLSVLSHCAIGLDWSMVSNDNGGTMSNITLVYEEGREFTEKFVHGMNSESKDISTDTDRSSIHKMATQGVYMKYPLTCVKYNCKVA